MDESGKGLSGDSRTYSSSLHCKGLIVCSFLNGQWAVNVHRCGYNRTLQHQRSGAEKAYSLAVAYTLSASLHIRFSVLWAEGFANSQSIVPKNESPRKNQRSPRHRDVWCRMNTDLEAAFNPVEHLLNLSDPTVLNISERIDILRLETQSKARQPMAL